MNRNFVSHLIFSFLVISKFLNVKGANSCETDVARPDTELNKLLSKNALRFGLILYGHLQGGRNIFISPFSILMTYIMTDEAAAEITFYHLKRQPPEYYVSFMTRVKRAFQQYLHSLCPNEKFPLSVANRLYLRNPLPLVNRTFIQTLKTFFWSDAEDVDFRNNPNGVATYINQWVEQQTLNRIKDLISLRSLSPEPVQILINTVYFNGKWEIPFDAAHTVPRSFILANGQPIQVPTMFSRNFFNYAFNDEINSQVLQLNLDGGRFAMLIILPKSRTNVTNFRRKLLYAVGDFTANLTVQTVEVYLPKFQASYKEVLDEPVRNSSMPAGLNEKGVTSLVKVEHAAFVVVDEAGLMSAAAAAFTLDLRSEPLPQIIEGPFHPPPQPGPPLPPSIHFKVDHPCVYLIWDVRFKQVLFMGELDDPSM